MMRDRHDLPASTVHYVGKKELVMSKVAVIGAGPMGLAAAYQAVCDGQEVDVFEAASEPGGMAGHFDFGGISIERFYHFICKTDYATFELLEELGLVGSLRWVPTTMGLFINGRLNPWGDPISLLKLPGVSLLAKVRYGLFAFVCVRRNSWPTIEKESAEVWITRWSGQKVYDLFWRPLFKYKFFEYADNISAAWIWTRIRRIGRSRKNIMQEELGYLEGGSKTLVDALVNAIELGGGRIHLNSGVQQVEVSNGQVTGVRTAAGTTTVDYVISTCPTPYVSRMVPDLPVDWKQRFDSIHNIGVICVILKLRKSITSHFWVNILEPDLEIPGVIEFSNLRKVPNCSIVYVPYYMPVTNEKFSWSDERLFQEAFACLQRINPALEHSDVIDLKVARLRHGQPICEPGFAEKIPAIQTPIAGLQIADTCFYYPEDRGISESVRLGRQLAENLRDHKS
jgi:protoporphyrinogen oxidase